MHTALQAHSAFNVSTGLAQATRHVCTLVVSSVTAKAHTPTSRNTHTASGACTANACNHLRMNNTETGTDGENADRTETNYIDYLPNPTNDTAFISCVAEFALILRDSEYKGKANLSDVAARLDALGEYLAADELKAEFKTIVEKAVRSEL